MRVGDEISGASTARAPWREGQADVRGDGAVANHKPAVCVHPDAAAGNPVLTRVAGATREGVRLRVSTAGDLVVECDISRVDRGWLGRSIDATLKFGSTTTPADHGVRAATRAILVHLVAGQEGSWDMLTIRAAKFVDEVRLDACSFAVTMDLGCDVPPAGAGGGEVRIRAPGRRGAIAHFLGAAPRGAGLSIWLRTMYHRLRTRSQLAWKRIGPGSPEIDMVLPLPVPVARLMGAPAELTFEEVRHEAVLGHPRRFASYGTDVDHRVARGDRCFAGTTGGRIVFRMWLCTDAVFIAHRSPRLAAYGRAGYVYDSYTDPAWRGRSIRGAALHWVANRMSDSLDYLVLSVLPTNLASVRAARKAGFRAVDGREDAADDSLDAAAQY